MSQLEIIDSGVIYRNSDPGYKYVFAAFSHPVEIPSGEILCSYNRGQALYATDLTFYLARSLDGGKTWPEHTLVYDRSRDGNIHYSYHDPFLSRTRDGILVIVAFRVDRSDPEKPLFNEATGGLAPIEIVLFQSVDKGHTWVGPQIIPVPAGMVISPSSGIIELRNGEWFLPFDQWHGFDEPGPYRPKTVGLFSRDQGRNWGNAMSFADGSAAGQGFWHGKIVPLLDGRLFTLFWSANMQTGQDMPLHRCLGSADGRNWSTPEQTNIPGQTNNVVDLGQGRMAAIYTTRDAAHPGFYMVLSLDEGKSWDVQNQLQVWDATGRDKLGVAAPLAYPRSHDTIAFGAPTVIGLSNGDLLATFWCTEMSITHIRYVRVRVV